MGVGPEKGVGVESAREPGGLRPGWRKEREIRGCSLAQWVQRWVGGRVDGWGCVDFSYEGRVYENLAEVGDKWGGDSFPSIRRCYQRSHFQACNFQFAELPIKGREHLFS